MAAIFLIDSEHTTETAPGNYNLKNVRNITADFDQGGLRWGWWLLQIGTPVVLLVGIPGNVLSILILKSKRFRAKSYSHYLCALAIFDSLVLLFQYLDRLDSLLVATGAHRLKTSYGEAACKMHNFAEHVSYLMSSWLVLCMSLERYVAVNYPFKKDAICRPRSALIIILSVFAVLSYSQFFRLIMIEKVDGLYCGAPQRYLPVYLAVHIYLYQLLLLFLIPTFGILMCNLSILCKIRNLRSDVTLQRRIRHDETTPTSARLAPPSMQRAINPHAKRQKTTCILLIISFTYVITLLPNVLLSMIVHMVATTNEHVARAIFLSSNELCQLFELVALVNYGINFYIYVMSGPNFRRALAVICKRPLCITVPPRPEIIYQFRKTTSS